MKSQSKQHRPLRAVFLTPSLHIGGAERWILSLARNFQSVQPAAVVVCAPHYHATMLDQAARLMPVYLARKVGDAGETRRLLERACITADVLISWGVPRLARVSRNLVGRIADPSGKIPVIDVSHSDGSWQQQTKMVRGAAGGADFHVAVSRCAISAFPKEIRSRATVIYNGVEVDRVAPRRMRSADCGMRKERTALFLGRFEEVKGFDRLFEAARHLPKNWKIIAHGHGSLASKFRSPHSAIRIQLRPPVSHVGDVLAEADALVMPSRHEGMPLTLIEAWLAGTPAVTTPFGFVREAFEMHGPTHGQLCEVVPQNPTGKQLAAGITRAAEGKFVHAAREVAWNHYTAAAMAQRWEEYLYAAVGAHRRTQLSQKNRTSNTEH